MKKSRPYIWYMLPGLIFYTAFMILPIFLTALISLTGFNGVNWDTLTWVGGDNYVKLFTDPSNSSVYWNALINNLKFIAVEYVIIIPIQLLVSYAFYRKIHFHTFKDKRQSLIKEALFCLNKLVHKSIHSQTKQNFNLKRFLKHNFLLNPTGV